MLFFNKNCFVQETSQLRLRTRIAVFRELVVVSLLKLQAMTPKELAGWPVW